MFSIYKWGSRVKKVGKPWPKALTHTLILRFLLAFRFDITSNKLCTNLGADSSSKGFSMSGGKYVENNKYATWFIWDFNFSNHVRMRNCACYRLTYLLFTIKILCQKPNSHRILNLSVFMHYEPIICQSYIKMLHLALRPRSPGWVLISILWVIYYPTSIVYASSDFKNHSYFH